MRVKKLDRLLITSFFPPFVVTFFIALFVLVMQTLWLYIDDIAGKGIGFFLLVELVSYMSVSMIPMALPVAVLISSVMVLGNLAERYELSSIKSAGVSLWRVMRPLMVVTGCIGILSFFCSNYFIPVSNLKFKSRLHDIKNQKPALSLEESIFNYDFQGYSIRIGNKQDDGQTIEQVLLYDNREAGNGQISLVTSDSGKMYGSADGKYFVMQLYEGSQINEPKPSTKDGKRNYPLMRATFKEWTKVFDLNEFELDRTDENLFKSHHTMLSNRQLLIAIDSIDKTVQERLDRHDLQTNRHFYFWEKAYQERKKQEREAVIAKRKEESRKEKGQLSEEEELKQAYDIPDDIPVLPPKNRPVAEEDAVESDVPDEETGELSVDSAYLAAIAEVEGFESIAETFSKEKRRDYLPKAISTARTIKDQAENAVYALKKTLESRVKHIFEFHSKFSLAVACLIFLFVGAPMGAIVRKGGFGWPLLISIIFFMLFIIIGIFSKNIAERFVIDPVLAAWMNCLIIFPMGLLLTFWAMRDIGWTQLMDFFRVRFSFLVSVVKWFGNNTNRDKKVPQ